MTKKYWHDWQQRVGETKNIYKFYLYGDGTVRRLSYGGILYEHNGDNLLSAKFHGDAIDLVIERRKLCYDFANRSSHYHVENEYLTLHRKEIGRVEFIKHNTV